MLLLAVPPVVVTWTTLAPAVALGVTAVIEVAVATTLVAAMSPTFTVVAPAIKLVPVMVIVVPPRVDPDVGLTLAIVGTGNST